MVEVLDTLLAKSLQSYDKYTILNPLDIDIRSNYLTDKINEYKGSIYEVCIRNILFGSAIKNETQNIFLTCHNLNIAKNALINGKIYSLLGIVNLAEIQNWSQIKGNSIYVSGKFDDINYMQNAKHFAFKFKTSFPTELFEFKCELLDDKAKKMNKKENIQSITNDLKVILLKAKKEIKQKNDKLKSTKNVPQLT